MSETSTRLRRPVAVVTAPRRAPTIGRCTHRLGGVALRMALRMALCAALAAAPWVHAADTMTGAATYRVVGDSIPDPLSDTSPDVGRGRAIVASRQTGLCLLCHTAPIAEERFQGNIAPDLRGAGSRWSAGQLRLRLADPRRLNPTSVMPAYFRVDGLTRVGPAWLGKPVLSAAQIEDVIAYLQTLRD